MNVPLINDTELIGLLQFNSTKLNAILFDYVPVTIRIIDQKQDVGIVIWDATEKQFLRRHFNETFYKCRRFHIVDKL